MSLKPASASSSRESDGAGFGRLERVSSGSPMADINMTPLIDVMLVLLVIFIITAPLMVSAVKVELPKSPSTAAVNAPKFVSITVDKSGQMFVNDAPQSVQALGGLLQSTAQANPDAEVRLRADSAVPYGRVVEIMGLAHQAGLHRIGFVADAAQLPAASH